MLISEISKEHKENLEKMESDYKEKFKEYVDNEKVLK